ncbi:MAG: ABC transporter ATP-binding protein [Planctomycetota bacterium]|nr:ABC transporter ATP-binding protein [Planctomycetota bacterium]
MNKIIEIKDLTFAYPGGTPVLNNINLEVSEGESVGFIGPNGAGKSTLLLHLNGTLQGRNQSRLEGQSKNNALTIAGMGVNHTNIKTIRQKVGLVFQDPDDQLFMPTVFDDIAFGLINLGLKESQITESVNSVLSRFGLQGYEQKSPHHLSLGEKKKIALAGILVMNPEILVLDEPTANLDPRGRREFMELILNIPATKVIASHDLDMISRTTHRAVVMNKGKIITIGHTADIIKNHSLLSDNGLI